MAVLVFCLQLYWFSGSVVVNPHSRQSHSITIFQVNLGHPGQRFPATWSPRATFVAFLVLHVAVPSESVHSADVFEGNDSKHHEQSIGVDVGHIFGQGVAHPPNHYPVISLEAQQAALCHWPSLTSVLHYPSHIAAVHAPTCLVRMGSSSLNFF